MKVTVKQQPEEFKPVTLEITLESREEFEAFKNLCGSDKSAAKGAYCLPIRLEETASNILCAIYETIKQILP